MGLGATLVAIGRVFLDASVEIVPLFLLALLLGAAIEEFVSERVISRFLTGRHPGTMVLASLVGALIPLCTCGMVPLAVALRRRGGDVKHTFAFLTAGAAVSIPVLLLTWRVLGAPWMALRLFASVAFGLLVGYLSLIALRGSAARSATWGPAGAAGAAGAGAEAGNDDTPAYSPIPTRSRLESVFRRFLGETREYAPWVLVSLGLAAVIAVLVPEHWIHVLYGQATTLGTLVASLSGVPFYFCSGAELPLLRELVAKGMGAGPATAMMLAVPIVNVPTLGVVSRWLGPRGAVAYLLLCALAATILGTLTGFTVA